MKKPKKYKENETFQLVVILFALISFYIAIIVGISALLIYIVCGYVTLEDAIICGCNFSYSCMARFID